MCKSELDMYFTATEHAANTMLPAVYNQHPLQNNSTNSRNANARKCFNLKQN